MRSLFLFVGLLLLFLAKSYSLNCVGVVVEADQSGHPSTCKIVPYLTENVTANGCFQNMTLKTGWSNLRLNTMGDWSDDFKMYGVGCLEGYLTHDWISAHYSNAIKFLVDYYGEDTLANVFKFLGRNLEFVEKQIVKKDTPFWRFARLTLIQIKGMTHGYEIDLPTDKLGFMDFYLMASMGDVSMNAGFFKNYSVSDYMTESRNKMEQYTKDPHHCSALVALADDLSDIMVAHTTWVPYTGMLRIFKHVTLTLSDITLAAEKQSFSSYPGAVHSQDDFYILSSHLVITETSLGVGNYNVIPKFTRNIFAEAPLVWLRASAANRLSNTGREWCETFAKYNGGTFSNQWLVTDLKEFDPDTKRVGEDLLWVLEQYPGLIEYERQTSSLYFSHFPSYNVPFFKTMCEYGGYEEQGPYRYPDDPRANIFRRDAGNVNNIEDMKKFIRYNKFQTDPLSSGESEDSVAMRGDLDTPANPVGGIDGKATNYKMAMDQHAFAVSGPTTDDQPAFSWKQFPGIQHLGQPEVFDFDWVEF